MSTYTQPARLEYAGKDRMTISMVAVIALIPIINALADVSTNLVPNALIKPGDVRAIVLAIFVGTALILRPSKWSVAIAAYILLAYQFVRVLESSNIAYSLFASYVKVALSTLMVVIGYRYVRNRAALGRLTVALTSAAAVILVQLALSQIFKLGESEYVEDTLYMGGAQVQTSYTLAMFFVLAPLALALNDHKRRRLYIMIVAAASLLAVLLILRRGALLGMFVGLAVFAVLGRRKVWLTKRLIIPIIVAAVAFPFVLPTFIKRFEARSLENRPIEQEARLFETVRVLNDMKEAPASHVLFGSEMYNSPAYFQVKRQLHIDYNVLLHGSGVVGIALYGLFHLILVRAHIRARRRMPPGDIRAELNAAFWALLSMSLVISLSGSIVNIGYRSSLFLFLGAIVGVERGMAHSSAMYKPVVMTR